MVRRAFERKEWPVYLTGPTGTGKTSLAAYCLRGSLHHKAAEAVSDQQWPRWIAWPDFCSRLNALRIDPITVLHEDGRTYTADEPAWWRRWSTKRTVVVDEIGLATKSDAQVKAMWQLLECRRGLPTIFTGNLTEVQIQDMFDDRVLSRITQGTWIELKEGGDRRVTGFGDRRFVVGE